MIWIQTTRAVRRLVPSWHHQQPSSLLRCSSLHLPSRTTTIACQPSPIAAWKSSFSTSATTRRERKPLTEPPASQSATTDENSEPKKDVPSYDMTFTCKQCDTRSTHRISKQGYHHGTVLVTCPGCKNRHLISDHLKIFSDSRITLEDILKNNEELVKRGLLTPDGDIELYK